jgi:hypothetical protein
MVAASGLDPSACQIYPVPTADANLVARLRFEARRQIIVDTALLSWRSGGGSDGEQATASRGAQDGDEFFDR